MNKFVTFVLFILFLAGVVSNATAGYAQSDEELAKKLANPIGALIKVPFQFDYNDGFGRNDGEQVLLNLQPVAPFELTEKWGVISRTIMSVAWQDDTVGPSGSQFGLGDTLQSLFFSPNRPSQVDPLGSVKLGVGPVLSLPTATDELLGSEKWSAGPTAVAVIRNGPWVYGALSNHVWSFAGTDGRADVNRTFLQPFAAYVTKTAWTYSTNSESTYNWKTDDWTVPINFQVAKLVTISKQKISFLGGLRYWLESPDSGPDGFGTRFQIQFLFPK